jgi:hypothetical protein
MKELDAITKFAHPDGTALFGRFFNMKEIKVKKEIRIFVPVREGY